MYNDYTKSINIAHDWVRWPCVRVSSAEIPSSLSENAPLGKWYETWVFSECPKINTTQVTYKTMKKTIKAHGHIVRNLKDRLKDDTRKEEKVNGNV